MATRRLLVTPAGYPCPVESVKRTPRSSGETSLGVRFSPPGGTVNFRGRCSLYAGQLLGQVRTVRPWRRVSGTRMRFLIHFDPSPAVSFPRLLSELARHRLVVERGFGMVPFGPQKHRFVLHANGEERALQAVREVVHFEYTVEP